MYLAPAEIENVDKNAADTTQRSTYKYLLYLYLVKCFQTIQHVQYKY